MEHRCRYAGTDGNIAVVIPDRAIRAEFTRTPGHDRRWQRIPLFLHVRAVKP